MRKTAILFLLLALTGCAYPQDQAPKPMEPNPVPQDNSGIKAEQPADPELEESEEIPIYLEDLPIILSIREPNSIGTVYLDATYINKSEYPITRYFMTILLKDKNEKTYLSSHDTVLPGETSPNFDSFGPQTMDINDVEKLTLEITAKTENNKELYIEYDYKLGWAEWYYED